MTWTWIPRKSVRCSPAALALAAALAAIGCGSSSAPHAASTTTPVRHDAPAATGPARNLGKPGPPRPVPILMYHVISAPFPNSPYPSLYVPREQFADQVHALRVAGYTAVTLGEVWDSWHTGGPLPRRPVVLSFDDGYRSDVTHALPVLRAAGWPGVLNLELRNIRPDYGVTVPQVRALIAAGWEIDSHTIDHPDLRTVDAATLTHEVADSRTQLQRRFGIPVRFFCYPAGKYDDAVIAAVRAAGYLAATTTNPGLAQPAESDRFVLDRVRVNNGVTGSALVAQLSALRAG